MFWLFQPPPGAAFSLWAGTPGSTAVRLQFDAAKAGEVLRWLKEQVVACENSLQHATAQPAEVPKVVQRPAFVGGRIEPAPQSIPPLEVPKPVTLPPKQYRTTGGQTVDVSNIVPLEPRISPPSPGPVPPVHLAAQVQQAVPPEVAVLSQSVPPPQEDPPEVRAMKQSRVPHMPSVQSPALVRPPFESLELGNICPCQTVLSTQELLAQHWSEGHMDYVPPSDD